VIDIERGKEKGYKKMATPFKAETQRLIEQKLEVFERIRPDFEASFRFLEDMHGQQRFTALTIADAVRYLHARWICECKSRILSIAKTSKEYEGRRCLELLQQWQAGNTASTIDFLNHKLDMLPLSDITRQLQELPAQETKLAERLLHGRHVMLNRGMNLITLLDALFAPTQDHLIEEVRIACRQYGHESEQIERQMDEMNAPLYSYVPHQSLAQRNMLIMNALSVRVEAGPSDLPGHRTARVLPPKESPRPFAEEVIKGYQELTAPFHNNVKDVPFVDRPEENVNGEEV